MAHKINPEHQINTAPKKMANSAKVSEIYRKRAEKLSLSNEKDNDRGVPESYLKVLIGDNEYYGILQNQTEEILYVTGMSPVPCTPEFIIGIASLHGEMIAVIDLKAFLGVGKTRVSDESRIIVVSGSGMVAGVLVNKIEEETILYDVDLSPPLATEGGISPKFVRGLHQGSTAILDMKKILMDPEILINESVK